VRFECNLVAALVLIVSFSVCSGLPGFDKLTEDEKNLCSIVRLPPLGYSEYKAILMAENAKAGYVRLADARRLIKIDVNKTRQIYDFLIKAGFINKPFM
jgi:SWIRM domain